MTRKQSFRRGVAVVSSGALVVGAGAAVGVLAADMSAQWSQQAALEAAFEVQAPRATADPQPSGVVPRPRPSRRTVAPTPAAPTPAASAPRATSKAS